MKYLLSLTFLLIAMIAFGQSDTVESVIKYDSEKQNKEIDCGVMPFVEQMPMFPACDSLANYEERKPCADKAMLEFIYSNLKWPNEQGAVEGTVVISFIVEKNGNLTNIKIVRSLHHKFDRESLRVVNMLPDFIPAKQSGKPVRVQFNLPIRFRLE